MLTSAEKDKWKRIRNTLTPAFSALKMKQMIPLMNACCDNLIKKLSGVADKEQSVNISKWVCYVRFSFYSLLTYHSYCPCKPRSLNCVTCEFINLIVNYRQLWHQPGSPEWAGGRDLSNHTHMSTIKSNRPEPCNFIRKSCFTYPSGLVTERSISANPGLNFCFLYFSFLCIAESKILWCYYYCFLE